MLADLTFETLLTALRSLLLLLLVLSLPAQFVRVRLGGYVVIPGEEEEQRGLTERLVAEIVRVVGARYGDAAGSAPRTLELLRRAGYQRVTSAQFFTLRVGVALVFAIGSIFPGLLTGSLAVTGMFFVGTGLLGYMAPYFVVRRKARARIERARKELPSWLANYAVIMASGRSAETALTELSVSADGVLYSEGRRASEEILVGMTYAEALTAMAARLGSPELTAIFRQLIDLGTGNLAFREALFAEARTMQSQIEAEVRSRLADNQTMALAVMVVFAMPLLFYVVLIPYGLRLIGTLTGAP